MGTKNQTKNRKTIQPDECTSSLNCPPQDHCRECSHANFYGEVLSRGRMHNFEFNPIYGVTFLTKKGNPRKVQPAEDNPVWDEFEKWLDERIPTIE